MFEIRNGIHVGGFYYPCFFAAHGKICFSLDQELGMEIIEYIAIHDSDSLSVEESIRRPYMMITMSFGGMTRKTCVLLYLVAKTLFFSSLTVMEIILHL